MLLLEKELVALLDTGGWAGQPIDRCPFAKAKADQLHEFSRYRGTP